MSNELYTKGCSLDKVHDAELQAIIDSEIDKLPFSDDLFDENEFVHDDSLSFLYCE